VPLREAHASPSGRRVVCEKFVEVDATVERAFRVVRRGQVHLVEVIKERILDSWDSLHEHTDNSFLADVTLRSGLVQNLYFHGVALAHHHMV